MDIIETDSDRIKPLIEAGTASLLDASYCKAFDQYLCDQYPWLPVTAYSIDWKKVTKQYKRFWWNTADIEETTEFLKKTCMNKFQEVCIVYGAHQPGLVISFDYACRELENLTIFGWAVRFMVGVKKNKYGIVELEHECFVEIDFSDWLTASD